MQNIERPLFADEESDELLFLDDDQGSDSATVKEEAVWKVLIVDDEAEIHNVTRLALNKFRFLERSLSIKSAYSGAEARSVLEEDDSFAVIFLDVVMETDDAGLQVVNFIRNTLGNRHSRIILRTGQPGVAPEAQIITKYDIDDYKAKTELTVQKLHTCLVASLRTYNELMRIEALVQARTVELEQKNRDLLDSILYAKRIQKAILPSFEHINQYLAKYFVFFKPKDILSGDFYWFSQQSNFSIMAIVDCTGHGVPGAIMSVIGSNLLSSIINDQKIVEPSVILTELDSRLLEILNKDKDKNDAVQDGMDMSILVIDHKKQKFVVSSANRPILQVRGDQIIEYSGGRSPIGESLFKKEPFVDHELTVEPGDRLYMFTDGFADQFGGENEKKYTTKRLKEFILKIQPLSIDEQSRTVVNEFEQWKAHNTQTDDICFMGIELL